MDEKTHKSDKGVNIDELLSQHHISPTQQRRQIARIMFEKTQHLSADQVLERVNREKTVASKATIYNTLGLFAREGLVNEVIVDRSKVFYDSNTQPHHHFYNSDTGELKDIKEDYLTLNRYPSLPQDTELDKVDVIIHVHPKH